MSMIAQSGLPASSTARVPTRKPRDFLDRFLRRRKTDALQRMFRQRGQTFHAQCEMRAAPVVHHGVNLIHDQRSHRAQHSAGPDSEVSSR